MDISTIGQKITTLRKKKHITQTELAKNAGIQRTFLARIESGEINLTISNLLRITDALNISLSDFFAYEIVDELHHLEKKRITFLKLGGTWDMVETPEGLQGKGNLDDTDFAKLEKFLKHDEEALTEELEKIFHKIDENPEVLEVGRHLQWAKEMWKLVTGPFISLFSGDSSHYRPSLYAATLSFIFQRLKKWPAEPILIGVGTDTTDLLLPLLDAFLFDQDVHPVLVTGANRSYREAQSDAPQNFAALARAAHLQLKPGAYYIFQQTIYKGSDLLKIDPREEPQSLEGMLTFFAPHRTQMKLGFFPQQESVRKNSYAGEKFHAWKAPQIWQVFQEIVTVHLADLNPVEQDIAQILSPQYKAIIIEAHALGNASNPIRTAVIKAVKDGKLVIVVSRCFISNTSTRYFSSLISGNTHELKTSTKKILDGKQLSATSAHALLLRALLEKKDQQKTQELIDEYVDANFTSSAPSR